MLITLCRAMTCLSVIVLFTALVAGAEYDTCKRMQNEEKYSTLKMQSVKPWPGPVLSMNPV